MATTPKHLFHTPYGRNRWQLKCLRCGRQRIILEADDQVLCAITEPIQLALQAYARENGRTWKAKLRADWQDAQAQRTISPELQQARTIIGPSGLSRLTDAVLDNNLREIRRTR